MKPVNSRPLRQVCRLALMLIVCFAPPIAARAEPTARPMSPAEVLRAAHGASGDVEQLRLAIHGADPSLRVSTFAAMIDSHNPTLMALAIAEGHASPDPALRDLAARAAAGELRAFVVEPIEQDNPAMQDSYPKFTDSKGLTLRVTGYNWPTGQLEFSTDGRGQISASTFTFQSFSCRGTLVAVEHSWTYEGNVVCVHGSDRFAGRMRTRIR